MGYLEAIKRGILEGIKNRHRRIIVISGNNRETELIKILKDIFSIFKYKRLLFFGTSLKKDLEKKLSGICSRLGARFEYHLFKETDAFMGTTQEFLILDLTENLLPNDLGRLIETVKGGGIIIFLTPPLEKWKKMKLKYHEKLVTPPYKIEDTRNIFLSWFIKKLKEAEGVMIIDSDKRKIIKSFKRERKKKTNTKQLEIPKERMFSESIYKQCITQDQIDILKGLENVLVEDKISVIITANRGRGKSAVVGIFMAGFIEEMERKVKIGVTSPQIENLSTFFEFLEKTAKKIGSKVRKYEEKGFVRVKIGKGIIEYRKPPRLLKRRYDLVFIDEAAGIPVNLLYAFHEKFPKAIFSSTIHGYEGAGRSFSVRFLKRICETKEKKILHLKMKEPIRYGEGDPIEKFVYEVFLLDAEPEEISSKEIKRGVKYIAPKAEDLFLKNERMLRQFVGIYILAHYRNRPNDLLLLADAPHHFPRVLVVNGKVVNATQVAVEGGLDEEWIGRMIKGEAPSGNIIPDRILKYYRWKEFGYERGYRIVRIATHPTLMGRGIGSRMLTEIEKEARQLGFGWIGSGFGATPELLRFWLKNGFLPIHISPEKNEVSGEYSVIVIKPIKRDIKKVLQEINLEFKKRLIESLAEVHKDLDAKIARLLLSPFFKNMKYKEEFSKYEIHRLEGFIKGLFTYETSMDVIKKIVRWYFLNPKRFLDEKEEVLLIKKVFQHLSFREICRKEKISVKEAIKLLKRGIRKIWTEFKRTYRKAGRKKKR